KRRQVRGRRNNPKSAIRNPRSAVCFQLTEDSDPRRIGQWRKFIPALCPSDAIFLRNSNFLKVGRASGEIRATLEILIMTTAAAVEVSPPPYLQKTPYG